MQSEHNARASHVNRLSIEAERANNPSNRMRYVLIRVLFVAGHLASLTGCMYWLYRWLMVASVNLDKDCTLWRKPEPGE